MRWIQKSEEPPPSIRVFLEANLPLGVNLDYESGFGRKRQLCEELVAEQFGLCGYTGTPLKTEWLGQKQTGSGLLFRAHNEHIKSQHRCKTEQQERGETPGNHLGDDMDHKNIIAALELKCDGGTRETERFGPAVRKLDIVPMPPTDPACTSAYQYFEDGAIRSARHEAVETIKDLRLDHATLTGWRAGAIDAHLPERESTPPEQLKRIIAAMDSPSDGILPDFAFVVAQLAKDYLAMHEIKATSPDSPSA
jgi:hypothetical protein